MRAILSYAQNGREDLILGNCYHSLDAADRETLARTWVRVLEDIQVMYETLQSVDDLLEDQRRIHKAKIFLTSPYLAIDLQAQSYQHTQPARLTKRAILDDLEDNQFPDMVLLEQQIVSGSINGYSVPVSSLERHVHAKSAFSILNTYVDPQIKTFVQEKIANDLALESDRVAISSISQYLIQHVLTDSFRTTLGDSLVWYFHKTHSDLFVSNAGSLVNHTVMPYGEEAFHQQLVSQGLINPNQDPCSYIDAYQKDMLDIKHHERMNAFLRSERSIVLNATRTLLEANSNESDCYLPYRIFGISDTASAKVMFDNDIEHLSLEQLVSEY